MAKKRKPRMEFRYYEIPAGCPVLALLGEKWVKNYGRDVDYLHFHNHYEIGYCYSGEGILTLKDEDCEFRGDMFSLIPRNYPHTTNSAVGTISKWEYLFVDVDGFLEEMYRDNPLLADQLIRRINRKAHFYRVGEIPEMAVMVRQMLEIMRQGKELYQEEMKGVLLAFLIEVARINREEEDSGMSQKEIPPGTLIARALDYISDYYDKPIRVEQLAEACHISETHFRRVFSQCMHMTPVEYLNRVRIKMACDRLKTTNDQVNVVAAQVGFSSLSTFNRNFKEIMGKTPQEWRKKPEHYERKLLNYDIKTHEGW